MTEYTIKSTLSDWSDDDLKNLSFLLGVKDKNPTISHIAEQIKWLYYSKRSADIQKVAKNASRFIKSRITDEQYNPVKADDLYQVPLYSDLVKKCAEKLKIRDEDADLEALSIYISEAIIVRAMSKMQHTERHHLILEKLNTNEMLEQAGIKDNSGPASETTFALLGAANSAGVGLHVSSTIALGFVTHAMGITLPFTTYTGLTSTIGFVIGPAGWLTTGLWTFLKITGSDWQKLIRAVLYISSINSRHAIP